MLGNREQKRAKKKKGKSQNEKSEEKEKTRIGGSGLLSYETSCDKCSEVLPQFSGLDLVNKKKVTKKWAVTNGGLRDGGLSKSKDI